MKKRGVGMFSVGQLVLYGTNGVCRVDEITEKHIGNVKMEYYVLKPVTSAASTLYVPTSNEQLVGKMRGVLTRDEIKEVLSNKPEAGEWIESKQERTDFFKSVVSNGDCAALIGMIRQISFHRDRQLADGKRLHLSDERFLKEAEKMICEEFSMVLGIDRDKVIESVLA